MTDSSSTSPSGPVTEADFLAERQAFWISAMKFVTRAIIALIVLILVLWAWLV